MAELLRKVLTRKLVNIKLASGLSKWVDYTEHYALHIAERRNETLEEKYQKLSASRNLYGAVVCGSGNDDYYSNEEDVVSTSITLNVALARLDAQREKASRFRRWSNRRNIHRIDSMSMHTSRARALADKCAYLVQSYRGLYLLSNNLLELLCRNHVRRLCLMS